MRKRAEEHWKYTEDVIKLCLEIMKYLYIEAMIHGYKHAQDEIERAT